MLQKQHRFVFKILSLSVLTYIIMTLLAVFANYNSYDGHVLSVFRPAVQAGMKTTCWALLLVQVALCVALALRKKILWCTFIVLGFPVWLFGSVIAAFMYEPAPWMVSPCEVAADQHAYCLGESSFLQGQTLALLQRKDSGVLTNHYEIVARTNGDSPRFFMKVNLPKTAPHCPKGLCVYLSEDRTRLVATRYANFAYIAYDVNSMATWGNGHTGTLNIKKLPETYLSTGIPQK